MAHWLESIWNHKQINLIVVSRCAWLVVQLRKQSSIPAISLPHFLPGQGGVEKNLHQQPQKKGGGSANAPRYERSASDPRTRPFFPLSATKALERLPLCLFRKVLVVRWLSRVFPSGSSDVEENCLTPQLSSAVVRFVLEVKLYAFSLRAKATFTLFDQVSRACP